MFLKEILSLVPGLEEIPHDDLAAMFNFTFMWSLFEAQIMTTNARADRLCAKVAEWHAEGTLNAFQYDQELTYFRQRYFADGDFTHHYYHLHIRATDQPDLIRSILDGSNNAPEDRVKALLLIVWRLRNNLFHGQKWSYLLQGQLNNFVHANKVLIRILEDHGQPIS